MRIFSYFFALIIILFGISFAFLNSDPVSFNYYIGNREMPLSILLISTLALGTFFGLFVGMLILLRAKRQNYKLRKQIRKINVSNQ